MQDLAVNLIKKRNIDLRKRETKMLKSEFKLFKARSRSLLQSIKSFIKFANCDKGIAFL